MGKRVKFRFRQLRRELSAREQRDVTLQEVHEATGIAMSTLSRLERGNSTAVDLVILDKLATFYNLSSAAELLTIEDEPAAES